MTHPRTLKCDNKYADKKCDFPGWLPFGSGVVHLKHEGHHI